MDIDMSYVFQVSEDWTTQPFQDIVVTTEMTCPETHPSEAFYEVWAGATILCDCLEREDHIIERHIICQRGKNGRHNGEDCWEQNPMPPVV